MVKHLRSDTMKKYVVIYNGVVTDVIESEIEPMFHHSFTVIEVPLIVGVQPGDSYDYDTKDFGPPLPVRPMPEVRPLTVDERLERIESKLHEDSLVTMDVLATIFEQLTTSGGA